MAQPTTRSEFKEWCLRKLGKPVIEINVDDTQVEDRIDEALSFYWDYHFDGSQKTYLKHQVTQTDKDNGWIPIPESVIGAVSIFDVGSGLGLGSDIFNVKYQFVLNNISDFTSGRILNYYMATEHLQFLQEMLAGKKQIRYNRHENKLHIDTDWDFLEVGEYVIVECYQAVDPATYADVWKDRWLQTYASAKIKYQWGSNLTKFVGMNLPGNIQFNGEQILRDAQEEIQKLEEEVITNYGPIVVDMIG